MPGNSGSSPRAWGTRRLCFRRHPLFRFIPTGVGNTFGIATRHGRIPVHPHGRGEHLRSVTAMRFTAGSSPRAWGTLSLNALFAPSHRFIPTGVGNTHGRTTRSIATTVHPHGRGEHAAGEDVVVTDNGSSPRAWGTHRPPGQKPAL